MKVFLTLEITGVYEVRRKDLEALKQTLRDAAEHLYQQGMLTNGVDAEVESYGKYVKEEPR